MKVYAVKFNDNVFLRSYSPILDQTIITSDASNICFFNNFEKANKVAENVGGYVTTFMEEADE